jgi:hypothetical protein
MHGDQAETVSHQVVRVPRDPQPLRRDGPIPFGEEFTPLAVHPRPLQPQHRSG